MNASSQARANAVTLTASALVGLGMLAGCTSGGSSAAPPTATTPAARATPAASPSAMSAARLLSGALAAVRAGGSVHVDITSRSPDDSVTYSDDATGNGGRQVITFNGTGHATILLIDGVDYVQADAQALHGFFQAPLAQAEQAAGRWISVRPGEKLGTSTYDDVTAGITLSSVATELAVGSPLVRDRARHRGRPAGHRRAGAAPRQRRPARGEASALRDGRLGAAARAVRAGGRRELPRTRSPSAGGASG